MTSFNEGNSIVTEFLAQIAELSQRCCKLAIERDRARAELAAMVEKTRDDMRNNTHPASQIKAVP